jgi:internalin A
MKSRFNVKGVYRGNPELAGAADGLRGALEFFARNLPHIGEEVGIHSH